MKKVALLFSAGVESSSLAVHYLEGGYIVLPVYVKCGFPWEKVEIRWGERLWVFLKKKYRRLLPIRILPARGIGPEANSVEMPLRNLILVSTVALEALRRDIDRVGIGSLGMYPFPDNNREFFDDVERLLSRGARIRLEVDTPFMGLEKEEVIKHYYTKLPYRLTFSCMRPIKGMHCGRCEKCMERKEGFRKAGLPDPTRYLS